MTCRFWGLTLQRLFCEQSRIQAVLAAEFEQPFQLAQIERQLLAKEDTNTNKATPALVAGVCNPAGAKGARE